MCNQNITLYLPKDSTFEAFEIRDIWRKRENLLVVISITLRELKDVNTILKGDQHEHLKLHNGRVYKPFQENIDR